jgi:hypothetical protein
MRIHNKLALLTVSAVFAAAPAVAVAAGPQSGGPPDNHGTAHRPGDPGSQSATHKPFPPGPKASLPAKAKAYGKYCQGESRKHVAGQRGTPFSQCVTAMAKLASGKVDRPRAACKGESKKHVAGQRGTPFSRCVSAAAKLKADQASSDTDSSSEDS